MRFIVQILFIGLTGFSISQNSFPQKWTGEYEGEMIATFMSRPNDTLDIEFTLKEIEKDSIWTYTMAYKSDKWGDIVKDYRYITKKKGEFTHFIFDELNGIIMEMSLMNDCFYGMYEVMDIIYVSTLCRNGDELNFELFGAPSVNPTTSKTEPDEDGKSIEARSMKPNLVQSVNLKRK